MKKVIIFTLMLINVSTLLAQLKSFKFEESKRKYIIYLPPTYHSQSEHDFPLVLNFHGGGMTVAEQMLYTRMNESADKHNYIVVYPAGINSDWNVGFEMSYQKGTNDIGFIKALLESLKKEYRIEEKAIFATGLSRGGFFCHRLAAEMPETFAAIASIGGPIPDSVKHFHSSKGKVSIMQVHGTADEVVKYDGKENAYSSAQTTFDYWVKHNELSDRALNKKIINSNPNDNTSVTIFNASNKQGSVELVTIDNGGHTWPGSNEFNIGYPLGETTSDIDINDVIWRFFNENRKN